MGTFNPNISAESLEHMKKFYHLEAPLYVQYADWIKSVMHLNFGVSLVDGVSVIKKIASRLPVTVGINIAVLIISLAISIPISLFLYLADMLCRRFGLLYF